MRNAVGGLFATTGEIRVSYQFDRVEGLDQWWHWFLLAALVLLISAGVVAIYRRDTVELPRGLAGILIALRLLALVGLLLYFLDLEKRLEERVVKASRAVLLFDTSLSMGVKDQGVSQGEPVTRLEALQRVLEQQPLLDELRKRHDVLLYRFDEQQRPESIGFLGKRPAATSSSRDPSTEMVAATLPPAIPGFIGLGSLGLALIIVLVHVVLRTLQRDRQAYLLLAAFLVAVTGLVLLATTTLRYPSIGWREILSGRFAISDAAPAREQDGQSLSEELETDWMTQLHPRGKTTRLGDALLEILEQERGGTISGIAVFSDGNQNAGRPIQEAAQGAQSAGIPIFTVGLGTDRRPPNLRIVECDAPRKVYPGDAFRIRAFLQGFGLESKAAVMELLEFTTPKDGSNADPSSATSVKLQEERVRVGADGEVIPVEFELRPERIGRRDFLLRVSTGETDSEPQDNEFRVTVRVVDRTNRVLLIAGGPSRDYQFLSSLCYRDPEVTVDVWLQSSLPGAAQEADQVLSTFPETLAQLMQYDALVAFDPDWGQLRDEQAEWLDQWVAEQAGGLVLVSGPVFTPEWTTSRRDRKAITTIRGLYPVTFYRRGLQLGRQRFEAAVPSPIHVVDQPQLPRFLLLEDEPEPSLAVWNKFEGVYGHYPVRGPKPGATVLATCAGDSESGGTPPIFIASQFYGAGRVVYLGSGEIWRLRALDESYFDMFYTQLLRFVSEGRLLRDSPRGLLLVDQEKYYVGDVVTVRATLSDPQFRPLDVDKVELRIRAPQGDLQRLDLLPIRGTHRPGTYTGQFSATQEGDYRLELSLEDSSRFELLQADFRVRLPDLELERVERNHQVLQELADLSGGHYYRDAHHILGDSPLPSLASAFVPRDQESFIPGNADQQFQQSWYQYLMIWITGCLSLEWLLRRWNRLS